MSEFPKVITVYKYQFDTPLQALEKARINYAIPDDVPMTYIGRLDPMAEGQLLILIGDECKNRDEYLSRPKTYEVTIMFGISTDTLDLFGVIEGDPVHYSDEEFINIRERAQKEIVNFVGKHVFPYPKYSTKGLKVEEGEALPEREMIVTQIPDVLGSSQNGEYLKMTVATACEKIKGDFRFNEIKASWEKVKAHDWFPTIVAEIECESGTFMRTIAHELGKRLGVPAIASHIVRTRT